MILRLSILAASCFPNCAPPGGGGSCFPNCTPPAGSGWEGGSGSGLAGGALFIGLGLLLYSLLKRK